MNRFASKATLVLFGVSVFVLWAAWAAAPFSNPVTYYVKKELINVYSAGLFYTCALMSAAIYAIERQRERGGSGVGLSRFWRLAVAGFLVVMVDEYFDLHGMINVLVTHELLGFRRMPVLTRLDALVVGAYGVAGAWVLFHYRKRLTAIDGFFAFIVVGVAFGILSLTIDLLIQEQVASVLLEDGAKVLAATAFVLACLTALRQSFEQVAGSHDHAHSSGERRSHSHRVRYGRSPTASAVLTALGVRDATRGDRKERVNAAKQ